MKAKKSASKRINPEPGVHVARLVQIIDWGSQVDKFSGDEGRAKVEFVWELVEKHNLHVFNEDKGEQPLLVTRKYGNTLGRGSAMKVAIESMLGHKIDNDFELDSLLGEMCMLNLSIENDGEYDNVVIQSLMPLTKDQAKKKFPEHKPQFVFDLDNFDQDIYDQLPEWKQEAIAKSPEYAEIAASKPKGVVNAKAGVNVKANGKATEPATKASPFKKTAPAAKGGAGKAKK